MSSKIVAGLCSLLLFILPGLAFGQFPSGSIIPVGSVLLPGAVVYAPSGQARLAMQYDGNLVMYNASGGATLHSGTHGHPGAFAVYQHDGNLVVYDAASRYLWDLYSLMRQGRLPTPICYCAFPGSFMSVEDNGWFYTWYGPEVPWNTRTHGPFPGSATGPGILPAGATLQSGGSINSGNGLFSLVMQGDGNLVLYNADTWTPRWYSGTHGRPGVRAVVQADGNFVLYDPNNVPVWYTGTFIPSPFTFYAKYTYLAVQDDGNLVLYRYRINWSPQAPPGPGGPVRCPNGDFAPATAFCPGSGSPDDGFTCTISSDGWRCG